jgi:hypothetical protein
MSNCDDRYGIIDGDEVELHESHEFCEELFNECPNNVTLNGYFQSEKYFENVEKLIKSDFKFKQEIYDEVEKILEIILLLFLYDIIMIFLIILDAKKIIEIFQMNIFIKLLRDWVKIESILFVLMM